MEQLQRKPNRIENYDYSQNGTYFITICTQDRKNILSEIVGDGFPVSKPYGRIAEKVIHEIPKKYPCVSVDKYVIMPDHIHVLLRIDGMCALDDDLAGETFRHPEDKGAKNPTPTLGNVIGWYKYRVTKQINLLSGSAGEQLFQRSYYDHVIRNQQDYNEIWEYIENNPRRWIMQKQGRD